MRRTMFIVCSLVFLGLAVVHFLFTDTARAIFFSNKPKLVWSAPQSCPTTCNYAEVIVCCDHGYLLVGGGASLDLGDPPDNTNAADNVALQNSYPMDDKCWFADARELQNVPGSGGKNADGTNGVQTGPNCAFPTPSTSCWTNWNSTSAEPDPSINATNFEWFITAHAICVPKVHFW